MTTGQQLDILVQSVLHLSRRIRCARVTGNASPAMRAEIQGRLAREKRELERIAGVPFAEIRPAE